MVSTRNSPAPDRPIAVRERPRLTARSVVASTLLGLDPPELASGALVAGAELLGVAPGTTRVAISRMVAAGELQATPHGYRLAGHLLARQARQDLSRRGTPTRWDGRWRTAIVTAEARPAAERTELRHAMAALRHAELREGVWLRPHNLPPGTLPQAEAVVARQTLVVVGEVEGPVALAARLWDLEGWASTARDLLDELAPLQDRLDHHDATALAPAFVAAAAVLRHLQADPLLPAPLLPARWPGRDLRRHQERFDRSFRAVLRAWHLARR